MGDQKKYYKIIGQGGKIVHTENINDLLTLGSWGFGGFKTRAALKKAWAKEKRIWRVTSKKKLRKVV
jgi:hypothetical protein